MILEDKPWIDRLPTVLPDHFLDVQIHCQDGVCWGIAAVLAVCSRMLHAVLSDASPAQDGNIHLVLPDAIVSQVNLLMQLLLTGEVEALPGNRRQLNRIVKLLAVDLLQPRLHLSLAEQGPGRHCRLPGAISQRSRVSRQKGANGEPVANIKEPGTNTEALGTNYKKSGVYVKESSSSVPDAGTCYKKPSVKRGNRSVTNLIESGAYIKEYWVTVKESSASLRHSDASIRLSVASSHQSCALPTQHVASSQLSCALPTQHDVHSQQSCALSTQQGTNSKQSCALTTWHGATQAQQGSSINQSHASSWLSLTSTQLGVGIGQFGANSRQDCTNILLGTRNIQSGAFRQSSGATQAKQSVSIGPAGTIRPQSGETPSQPGSCRQIGALSNSHGTPLTQRRDAHQSVVPAQQQHAGTQVSDLCSRGPRSLSNEERSAERDPNQRAADSDPRWRPVGNSNWLGNRVPPAIRIEFDEETADMSMLCPDSDREQLESNNAIADWQVKKKRPEEQNSDRTAEESSLSSSGSDKAPGLKRNLKSKRASHGRHKWPVPEKKWRQTGMKYKAPSSDEGNAEFETKSDSRKVKTMTLTCPDCREAYRLVEDFIQHLQLRLCEVACPVESCSYRPALANGSCSEYWSQYLTSLANHIKAKHTRQAEFVCPLCSKSLITHEAYKYHVSQHDHQGKFFCKNCQKFFPRRSKSRHRDRCMTRGPASNRCAICFGLFSSEVNLQTHMRVHSGEYGYKCGECPKQFHQKNNLLVHSKRKHGTAA